MDFIYNSFIINYLFQQVESFKGAHLFIAGPLYLCPLYPLWFYDHFGFNKLLITLKKNDKEN